MIGPVVALPHPEAVLMSLRKYLMIVQHLRAWPRDRLKHRLHGIQHHVRRVFAYEKRRGFRLDFVPERAEVLYNTLMNQCIQKITEKMEAISKSRLQTS
jgi:hypothetical protein